MATVTRIAVSAPSSPGGLASSCRDLTRAGMPSTEARPAAPEGPR